VKKILIFSAIFVIVILLFTIGKTGFKQNKNSSPENVSKTKIQNMRILSPVFKQNEKIPSKYSCDGQSINPQLNIYEIPENTKTLALIVDDPDAPMGTFVHWVVFNIDPVKTIINEDEKARFGVLGVNSAGKLNFVAPCPPSGTHRYFFKLYALNAELNLPEGSDKTAVENAMKNHILGKAELIGLYSKS
jgi:Raf kinase inhibitor-like YbhB/YbcL family protein